MTLEGPSGKTVNVKVKDPALLKEIKAGEQVEMVITEALRDRGRGAEEKEVSSFRDCGTTERTCGSAFFLHDVWEIRKHGAPRRRYCRGKNEDERKQALSPLIRPGRPHGGRRRADMVATPHNEVETSAQTSHPVHGRCGGASGRWLRNPERNESAAGECFQCHAPGHDVVRAEVPRAAPDPEPERLRSRGQGA